MGELVPAEIEAYAVEHSMEESELCRELRAETYRHMESPQMLVGPLEGVLKMLTQLVRATHVLGNRHVHGVSSALFCRSLASSRHGDYLRDRRGICRAGPSLFCSVYHMELKFPSAWAQPLRRCGHLIDSMMSSSSMRTNRTT